MNIVNYLHWRFQVLKIIHQDLHPKVFTVILTAGRRPPLPLRPSFPVRQAQSLVLEQPSSDRLWQQAQHALTLFSTSKSKLHSVLSAPESPNACMYLPVITSYHSPFSENSVSCLMPAGSHSHLIALLQPFMTPERWFSLEDSEAPAAPQKKLHFSSHISPGQKVGWGSHVTSRS